MPITKGRLIVYTIDEYHEHFACDYVTYIIQSLASGKVYVGSTKNFSHRLRQHNREISGGAAETYYMYPLKPLAIIKGFTDRKQCLRFEFRLRRPKRGNRKNLSDILKNLKILLNSGDGSINKNNKRPWLPIKITWHDVRYSIPNVDNQYL